MRRRRSVLLAGGALLVLCACVGLIGGASFFFGSWGPCGQDGNASSANITVFPGQTTSHITACRGNVVVLGHVTGNVTAYGGSIDVASLGIVDGDITSYGGGVEVAGLVQGDVTSYGGSITLDAASHIQGDVQTYSGGITKMAGAKVDGSIDRNHPTSFSLTNLPFLNPFGFSFPGVSIIVWVLIAAALAHWFPQRTLRVGEVMFSNLPRSLAIGALSWVLGLILAVILALTIVGIPLTLVILLVLAAGGVLGNIVIGWLIGRSILQRVAHRDYSPVLEAVVGVAILALIESLPFLGFLLSIFIALLGVGAALLSRFGSSRWRVSSFRRRAG